MSGERQPEPRADAPMRHADGPTRHVIRLHGPWTEAGTMPPRRWKVPLSLRAWQTAYPNVDPPSTTLCLVRRFGKPTGLSPETRLTLAWHAADFPVTIELNESTRVAIPIQTHHRLDVTRLLSVNNQLQVVIDSLPTAPPDTPLWLIRSVTLEIEEPHS